MIVLKILLGLLEVFFVHSIVPTYYNKLFNKRVVKEVDGDKNIMLTFDDGPDRRYIYDLMDLLDRHDVKAIFFMVGENAEKNKDIVKELVDRGHRVGMHSWQHKNAMLYSYFYTKKDFENSIRIMKELNLNTRLYRPPWGHVNIFSNYFANKYGMRLIYWNVMAEDWKASSSPKMIHRKLLDRVKSHSIICLHDAGENSGGAPGAPINMMGGLDLAIRDLKDLGYKFKID